MKLGWLIASTLVGCAPTYAYRFEVAAEAPPAPGVAPAPSPITAHTEVGDDEAIHVDLSNRSSDLVQVEWTKITIDRGDHTTTRLHPAADLGWIAPGQTASAVLVPFALPRKGDAAAAYDGRTLELTIPITVQRQTGRFHIHLVAHVHKL